MSRRIALAIFLTVAVTLMLCGALVYFSVRTVLVRDLDATLLQRAALLHNITDEDGSELEQSHAVHPADRSIVQNERHQTLARHPVETGGPQPQILSAQFVTMPDGSPMRTLRIQAYARLTEADSVKPVVITYSGSAHEFDALMRSILIAIVASVMLGGVIAGLMAKWLAHRTLRPLRETVDSVAAIDFASLHHRFKVHLMPGELRPMADTLNKMLDRTDRDTAVIEVIDNGDGIEQAHLDQITRPGFRVRPEDSTDDHMGIGLALVESALLEIGATMDITSAPGEGSTFAIRIPLVLAFAE